MLCTENEPQLSLQTISGFTLVVAAGSSIKKLVSRASYRTVTVSQPGWQDKVNSVCREHGVPFLGLFHHMSPAIDRILVAAVGSVGCSSFAFADFLKHTYTE